MILSGKTKVYGIFGDPIAHSLSPAMQNHAFRHYEIDAAYVPFHVLPENLESAVSSLRVLNIAGVNVTVPHKEKIIPFLDAIDPATQLIGAVNTVVNNDGVLTGYNTDASGFMRSLRGSMEFEPLGKNVVILGAGGACRAVSVALAFAGVNSIMVVNRHPERADNLISGLKPHFHDVRLASSGYSDDAYLTALAEADLVVNATSVGLHGERLAFLPLECIKGSAFIFDMIYSLSKTTLIKSAHELNLRSDDGLSMLAAQGEDAFALWTGLQPAQGFMRDFLIRRRTE